MSYPSDRLFEEVAYLSRYLHWSYDEVVRLDHLQRRRWVAQVAAVNEELNRRDH